MTDTDELVIFGRRPDEPQSQEQVLLTHAERYDLDAAIARMWADGWVVRVVRVDLKTPPNFPGAIA